MVHFTEMTDEERLARLERKAEEIRKMLFGILLMAKDAWKDNLSQRREGLEIIEAVEKAEELFTEGTPHDSLKRLEHTIDIINQRAKSIFDLMLYIAENKKHD